MEKLSINLLQAELIAVQPLWNLNRVVILWLFSLLISLSWWWWADHQYQQKLTQHKTLTAENTRLTAREEELKIQLENNNVDPQLREQLDTLSLLLKNKQQILSQLTDSSATESAGFSPAMTELAKFHHRDISLQNIAIIDSDITFSGVARRPEAVPKWLAAFEQSVFLSGKSFSHVSFWQNKQNITSFTVSSSVTANSAAGNQGDER